MTNSVLLVLFCLLYGATSCSSSISDEEAAKILYMTEGFCQLGLYDQAISQAKKIPRSSSAHPKAQRWIEISKELKEELENNPEKYAVDYWRGSPAQLLIEKRLGEFSRD